MYNQKHFGKIKANVLTQINIRVRSQNLTKMCHIKMKRKMRNIFFKHNYDKFEDH